MLPSQSQLVLVWLPCNFGSCVSHINLGVLERSNMVPSLLILSFRLSVSCFIRDSLLTLSVSLFVQTSDPVLFLLACRTTVHTTKHRLCEASFPKLLKGLTKPHLRRGSWVNKSRLEVPSILPYCSKNKPNESNSEKSNESPMSENPEFWTQSLASTWKRRIRIRLSWVSASVKWCDDYVNVVALVGKELTYAKPSIRKLNNMHYMHSWGMNGDIQACLGQRRFLPRWLRAITNERGSILDLSEESSKWRKGLIAILSTQDVGRLPLPDIQHQLWPWQI